MTIQAMEQDDVDFGLWVGVNGCNVVARDAAVDVGL